MTLAAINAALDRLLPPQPEGLQKSLFEAARYSLLSGGKRLRPQLTLITASCYGVPQEKAMMPACALELIHTYSLIHDDLPCMDDDDFRRGQPTLHKIYGEAHAVLTGDFLLTYAFEVLAKSPYLTADQKVSLTTILAQRAGAVGMIGGQAIDIAFQDQVMDSTLRQCVHAHKTAALIAAALEFGSVIADAPAKDLSLLHRAGMKLGVGFQLVDDLLDKQAGDPSKARSESDALYKEALHQIQSLSVPSPELEKLFHQLIYRDA